MQVFKFTNGSPEWLHKRRQYLTATEVASLFGLNPYKSANKLIKSKLIPEPPFDSIHMRAGRIFESSVFMDLRERGIIAKQPGDGNVVMIAHDTVKISASLDGYIISEEGNHIVEAKTTIEKIREWDSNPPIAYILQVQTQLMISGYKSGILACLSLTAPFPGIGYEIQPNKIIHDLILEETNRFWNCLENNKNFVVHQPSKRIILQHIYDGIELLYN